MLSVAAALTLWLLCASAPVVAPPELTQSVAPVYPATALHDRREGEVGLRITLSAAGEVDRVEVLRSAGADLDWAALGALTQFRFSPALVDGAPTAVSLDSTLRFSLPRASAAAPPVPAPSSARPTFQLAGRVREAGTVQPLGFADVLITPMPPGSAPTLTTRTDLEGRFGLALPEGPYEVGVALQGYEPATLSQWFSGGDEHQLDIALTALASNRFETVVGARRGDPPVSQVSLSRAELTGIPGTYGDALRVLESLPGVARAPLLGGALMVRGGYPADTSVHFEGVPIPVLYHFGGFTSVINGAFVEEIQFMAGGFPVRYGNATAGIVDVRAHALDSDTPQAHLDADLFDVGAFFGGAIHPSDAVPTLRFGFAARRSHAEGPGSLVLWGAEAFGGATGQAIPFLPVPVYNDYQLKLQMDVTATSRLSFFMFGAEDNWAVLGEEPILGTDANDGDITLDTVLNTFLANRFHRAMLSWELRPTPGVVSTVRPWVGLTRRGLLSDGVAVPLLSGATIDTPTEETNFGLRQELAIKPLPWWRALVGLEVNGALANLSVLGGPASLGADTPDGQATGLLTVHQRLLSTALYAESALALTPRLSVTPGVRVELSSLRFDVDDGTALYDGSPSQLADSFDVDPRVQLRFAQSSELVWKGAFGTFHQRPRAQSAAYDNDGEGLTSPSALQVIGGFEATLWGPLSLGAQLYGTHRTQLVQERARFYAPGRDGPASPIPGAGPFDNHGSGDTGGFELMLRVAPSERFFGWVSYTFSRTVVRLGDHREREVPFPFDQTHNLVVVAKANLPWQLTLGGRFALVTGNPGPISDAVATRHTLLDNGYTPVISSLRASRLPPFHRLDLRLDRRFVFSWCTLVPFLEVINVYNYPNAEVVYPGGDYRAREVRTLLPDPPLLPLLGVELSL